MCCVDVVAKFISLVLRAFTKTNSCLKFILSLELLFALCIFFIGAHETLRLVVPFGSSQKKRKMYKEMPVFL